MAVRSPGITGVTAEDVAAAIDHGRVLKLIASGRLLDDGSLEAAVLPTAVFGATALAATDGVLNRIEVEAEPVGTVAFAGPGAGGAATSSAVLGDLVAIARGGSSTWAGCRRRWSGPRSAWSRRAGRRSRRRRACATRSRSERGVRVPAARPSLVERYRPFLPIGATTRVVSLGEGSTPLVHARRLGAQLGLANLYLKLEGMNPTGSFKDRGMVVAVAKALEARGRRPAHRPATPRRRRPRTPRPRGWSASSSCRVARSPWASCSRRWWPERGSWRSTARSMTRCASSARSRNRTTTRSRW